MALAISTRFTSHKILGRKATAWERFHFKVSTRLIWIDRWLVQYDPIVRYYPTTLHLFNFKTSDFLLLFDCEEKEENQKASQEGFHTIHYHCNVTSTRTPQTKTNKQTNKQTKTNKQTNKQTNGTTSQHHKPCLWFISTWVQGRCKIWYDMASKTRGATYAPRWHHGALYHVTCKTLYILWECVTTFRTESLGFEALPGEESQWQMGSLQRDRGPGLQHTRMHIHSYLPEVKR